MRARARLSAPAHVDSVQQSWTPSTSLDSVQHAALRPLRFDRNRDGVGDTAHEIFAYADRIWRDHPYAQFFKGSPLLETLDFLERLAPFSEPQLLVRDTAPKLKKEEAGMDQAVKTAEAKGIARVK